LNDAGSELVNIAVSYIYRDEYAEAIYYLNRAIELKSKYKKQFDSGETSIGTPVYIYNKYVYFKTPNDSSLSDTYLNLGSVYASIGNYTEAGHYFQQGLSIKQVLGETYGEAVALNQIGLMFMDNKDFKSAEWYFEQALPLLEAHGNKQAVATIYCNLGNINITPQTLSKAKAYFERSKELFSEIEYPLGQLMVMEQQTAIALFEKNHQRVFELVSQGLSLSGTLSAKVYEGSFYDMLGDSFAAQDRPPEAIMSYNHSIVTFRDQDADAKEAEVLLKLIAIHKEHGNLADALSCFEYYQQKKDKVLNLENANYLRNIQVQHQLEIYKKNEELAKAKINQLEMQLIIRQKETELLNQELTLRSQLILEQMQEVSKFISNILDITDKMDNPESIIRKVKSKLRHSSIMQESWKSYLEVFAQLHPTFESTLLELYPKLTRMELRLCILLKAGLRTEEISQILSLSSRTIENHRFRMRRKLSLDERTNLSLKIQIL
jgi:tetratricopeptide (TPR) repeat protein